MVLLFRLFTTEVSVEDKIWAATYTDGVQKACRARLKMSLTQERYTAEYI